VKIIVHLPDTEQGMSELTRKAAQLHAEAISGYVAKLNCPQTQKLELVDAVVDIVKKAQGEAVG